ncbi:tuberin-like isoform X3 [Panulirus ornatus]|uniref:tuberin-like isoform X3 n=1 Tax=Panulirus ornatus TaxID=150431 RepID=UPI003A89FDB1
MHCLAGTHVGNSGVRVLCHLIEKAPDPQIVRGAVFFLTTVLWGSKKVSSLNCTPFAVLPTLYKASQNSHVLVVFEVALGIQKLVTRSSFELYLHSWNIVIEMLINAFRSTICLEDDSTEKTTILSVLMDTMDTIEQLVEKQEFRGSLERFYFLVDLYSHLWPEDSVVKLLDYQAKIINPFHPLWLVNLRALLSHHYCLDTRTSIKMKALTILTNVYSNNRHMYGRDIVKTVVLIHLEGVEKETDVRVRTAVVNLLIQIADTQESEIVLDVLSILEKVVTAPYKRNGKPLVQESEATDIVAAVEGLIKVYKVKMFELPSSHAVVAYRILLSFLEYHYCNQIILERVTRIRYQILEMILEMRVNSKYQIGFPGLNIKDGKDEGGLVSFLLPCFSPYLTVDHKPGQKLSAAHREREQQEEELLGFSPTRIHNVLTKGRKHELVKSSEETVKENTPHIAAVESLPPKFEVTSLSLIETAKIIITSLNKEKDWIVLCFILQRLPQALQNKIVVLSQGDTDTFLVSALCDLVADKSRNLPDCLYNKPARFSRSAFQGYVYPVLAMLASHHLHLDCDIQQKVIRCLQMGIINRYAGPLCISALTLCVLEMQDTVIKQLPGLILHFSKISATVQNSRPMMEFLSTLLHFPKVYANFVSEQYKSVFAIAIPYTNPLKFNQYIVSLAYHVIAMWFLKCRLPCRKGFVTFISKHLNLVLKNMSEAFKSKHLSRTEPEKSKKDEDKENSMKQFFSDLRETIVDLMARHTFASCTPLPKRDSVADMLVSRGQSATWLIGNKLVTITTSGCSQRLLQNGLCDKCYQLCNKKYDYSSSTGLKERTKENLFPSDDHPVHSYSGENASNSGIKNTQTEPHLCACWCQRWAEIYVRQPTGNVSWIMRIQNELTLMTSEGELPLLKLSDLYAPRAFQDQNDSSVFYDIRVDDDKDMKNGSRRSIPGSSHVSSSSCTCTGDDERRGSMLSPQPMQRNRGHSISDMNPASCRVHAEVAAVTNANIPASDKNTKGGISPSFVFLQLYYHGKMGNDDDRPLLLPTDQIEIQRALRVIDFIRPQETHKIGVLYVGKGQTTEQQILKNTFGSLRYMIFLQGLGSVVELRTVSRDVFLGGLDTNGTDGQIAYIWQDDMMQVVFHVSTLIPTKDSDPNCIGKKRHIGNNYVTIVYNESNRPYSIGTVKGQFNHTVVEVTPGEHSINTVSVLCRPELKEYVGIDTHRLVSDDNLPIVVRQLALHADLASVVWESLYHLPFSPYAGNWIERLRKIRKIREIVLQDIGNRSKWEKPRELIDFTDLVVRKSRTGGSEHRIYSTE